MLVNNYYYYYLIRLLVDLVSSLIILIKFKDLFGAVEKNMIEK